MNYYKNKFGFEITSTKMSYDDDDSDDEDDDDKQPYYFMRLDLSRVSGGKKKNKKSIKRNSNSIKRNMNSLKRNGKRISTRKRKLRKL